VEEVVRMPSIYRVTVRTSSRRQRRFTVGATRGLVACDAVLRHVDEESHGRNLVESALKNREAVAVQVTRVESCKRAGDHPLREVT
jgi:hypothetical protein